MWLVQHVVVIFLICGFVKPVLTSLAWILVSVHRLRGSGSGWAEGLLIKGIALGQSRALLLGQILHNEPDSWQVQNVVQVPPSLFRICSQHLGLSGLLRHFACKARCLCSFSDLIGRMAFGQLIWPFWAFLHLWNGETALFSIENWTKALMLCYIPNAALNI